MPIEEQAEEKIQNVVQTIITGGARLMLRIPKGVAMALLRSGMKLAKTGVFCQVGVGRFGVSFSPCERRVSGRFGVGRSCWLLVIALVIA